MPNFFRNKKKGKVAVKFLHVSYEVYCTIDASYKRSLRLIGKNPFLAKNQTQRCYRVNISATKVASSSLRNELSIRYIK